MTDSTKYAEWMLERGLSVCTIEQRAWFADARFAEWGRWDVPPLVIARWLSQWSGWTAITYHSHLKALFGWLLETGAIEEDPTRLVRRPTTPRPDPKPLSDEEVGRVLGSSLEGDLRAQALLALRAGLRVHEVAKFRGEHIDRRAITVLGKGAKLDTVPTHPHLWELAQEYPRRGLWFPDVEHGHVPAHRVSARIARHFRLCGIEHGSIHRLRATYATELRRKGVDLRVIQKLLRHSSLATTEHYLGVDEDELSAAIGLLGVIETGTTAPLAA